MFFKSDEFIEIEKQASTIKDIYIIYIGIVENDYDKALELANERLIKTQEKISAFGLIKANEIIFDEIRNK